MRHRDSSRQHKYPLATALACAALYWTSLAQAQSHEVWLVDQSNSPGRGYGGTIHIYDGASLAGNGPARVTDVVDLGAAARSLCRSATEADPVRPHMLFFNADHSRAVLSFVASGHVVIFNAATREPVACLRSPPGDGGARQAHAAFPAPDDSYIVVANQNGERLHKITADFVNDSYSLTDTLDLSALEAAVGAGGAAANNKPICPIIDSSSNLVFTTLAGGGLVVTDRDLDVVSLYTTSQLHANGCGGAQAGGSIYINSGGGTLANRSECDVYRFQLNASYPHLPPSGFNVIFSDDAPKVDTDGNGVLDTGRDCHGMTATKHGRYLWMDDRRLNEFLVFDTAVNALVNRVDVSGLLSSDPGPDLVDISPSGNRLFVSLRGPNPLTGDPHASRGNTPGLMTIQLTEGGKHGVIKRVDRISNVDAGDVERADGHGVRVRRK